MRLPKEAGPIPPCQCRDHATGRHVQWTGPAFAGGGFVPADGGVAAIPFGRPQRSDEGSPLLAIAAVPGPADQLAQSRQFGAGAGSPMTLRSGRQDRMSEANGVPQLLSLLARDPPVPASEDAPVGWGGPQQIQG